MEKRYQVFISSTFTDLQVERQAVLRSILELNHIPAGMELFPAADDTAWRLIQDVIIASDYYVLIIGGRYGSLDKEGLGFTEREYEFAVMQKKPILAFLHENPDSLPREKTETNGEIWDKLKVFRSTIEKNHTCVYWKTPEDLRAKVIIGLTQAIKHHPGTGWIRADQMPSDATVSEILTLRDKISELERKADLDRTKPPLGSEILQQGDESYEIQMSFWANTEPKDDEEEINDDTSYTGSIFATWNDIFAAIAPSLISKSSDSELRETFKRFFERRARKELEKKSKFKDKSLHGFFISHDVIDTCIVQLRALGLIRESIRTRRAKESGIYWTLTPYGDQIMVQLRAIRKIQVINLLFITLISRRPNTRLQLTWPRLSERTPICGF